MRKCVFPVCVSVLPVYLRKLRDLKRNRIWCVPNVNKRELRTGMRM